MPHDSEEPIDSAERRLRELLESAPDAILEIDDQGRIVLLNRMAERLFGYTREELLGQTVDKLVPDALRVTHKQHRAHYLSHPATRPMGSALKLEARRKDGSHFPVEISLSPVESESGLRVTAIIRDTTERRRAEERQREAEQRFRLMIEAVRDYAIFTLSPEGMVASWNMGAQRIKQYTAEEIVGKHFSVFYLLEDRDTRPAKELEIVRATGRFEEEGWRVRKDGSAFWANVAITEVRNSAGDLVGFSKVTHDLTERKRVQDQLLDVQQKYVHELELRNRESEQANQLKTEFLANMSHELRSPLHTVIGFSELLADEIEGQLNEKQKRFINHIHTDAMHLLHLINDLLDLSKIEAGQFELRQELFLMDAVLEEALFSVQPRATAKLVEIRIGVSIPTIVYADRLRFKQILHNLLTNAIKFTPGGGTVWVESATRDGFAEVSVLDTGIGIPEDQHQAVFDKFYQVQASTKGGPEGTGLGLAITKRLVEQHGGRIWLKSTPGKGCCFTFTVPLKNPL
jgi:PAS domain S-box-containing protein